MIVLILFWMATAVIAGPTTDHEEITMILTESSLTVEGQNSTAINSSTGVRDEMPTTIQPPDGPSVTIGNLSIPVCAEQHICPDTESCNISQATNQPCYCDEECTFFGDCCPASVSKNNTGSCSLNKDEGFPSVYNYGRSQFTCDNVASRPGKAKYFYLISRCPSGFDNEQIRAKCETVSSSTFSLESVPLSLENVVSFRNVYCAICHGQDPVRLTPWLVSMQCVGEVTEDLKNNTRTIEEVLRDGLCLVYVNPTSPGKDVRGCLGTSSVSIYVDSCPPSSDKELHSACVSMTAHIFFEDNEGQCFGYKNPACYACTIGHFPDPLNICTDRCTSDWGTGLLTPPLSVLFDFSSESGVRILEEDTVVSETRVGCQSGEVFDPYIGSCVRLSCPQGYEMIGNDCAGEVSAYDLACRPLSSDYSKVITVTMITVDQGMCDLGAKDQSCNVDGLVRALNIQSMLACEQNEFSDKYKAIFLWELEEDTVPNDVNIVLSEFSGNITNSETCNISSISLYRRCSPNTFGNDDICTKGFDKAFTLPTVTDTHDDEQHQSLETADSKTGYEFKVLERVYNLIQNRQEVVKNMSVFRCNITATELLCPSAIFNFSLFIRVGDDGILQYVPSGDFINPGEYVLIGDGTIRACQFLSQNGTFNETTQYYFFRYSSTQTKLSLAGTTLSLASLFITLVCYITFPPLRRLVSNKLIMALCGTLFVAQCLLMFGGMASSVSQHLCAALAAVSHFFWLTAFTLSSSIAFDLKRTFGSGKAIKVSTASCKVLALYILVATGIPLVIVSVTLALSFSMDEDFNLYYGDELACWVGGGQANLVVFGAPILVLLVFNLCCFLDTVRGISQSKKESKALHEGAENPRNHRELLKIAIKISSLMGFTWLCGFVAAFSRHQAVWYVFIIINSLQGVYIFLAFAATRRVCDLWRGLLLDNHRGGDSSLQLKDRTTSSSVQKTSI